jgi:NADH:ubiquinone oxidoreductase subunit 5 (chain L)/Multisubunit Na+/H+ antiporter, MnhA subunit
MSLLIIVLLPFAGSLCAALLPPNARNVEAWLAGVIALTCAVLAAGQYPAVADGGVVRFALPWVPSIGLEFSLRMDGLAWLFTMLITVIGTLVVLYARYYMSPQDPVPRFFSFLLAFMGAMLGVVVSGNLIQLALFWELTSLASFLLIAYWHHRVDARQGARMAFTVTAMGGLCLLGGLLLLGRIAGSYELDAVLAAGDVVRANPDYPIVLALVALGALTKSAQFPFHFWLPHAMAAPTPVSAFLHSATMVKAGVFLLVRLYPVLGGTEQWLWIIGGAGGITLVLGAYAAMFQHDLKGVLAYSTISHLGLITLLLGMQSDLATVAAIFHIVNHATFKASLFMAVGIIDHETGTRDIRRLSGLARVMPITAGLAIIASAAMAGVPLLNGFLSKEMFFAETVMVGGSALQRYGLPIAATLAGAFGVIYSLRFIHQVFFGPVAQDLPREPHEAPRWMRFPVELLVLACLVVGTLPAVTVGPFLHTAALSVLGDKLPEYSLAIWHGVTTPLVMSMLATGGGVVIYVLMRRYLRQGSIDGTPLIYRFDGRRTYESLQEAVTLGAEWVVRLASSARLQPQMAVIACASLAAGAVPVLASASGWAAWPPTPADPLFALLWAIGGACAIAAAYQAKYHRLAALILMGGAGLVTCLTFVWLSAPDLALTQLAVEVVTVVLILLGLRWLPKRLPEIYDTRPPARVRLRRLRDFAIATATGAGLAWASYAALVHGLPESIAPFFLEHALPDGGGANVVNVILVDFRGFDTMGEIVVLGVVALTVYALLRRFRPAPESMDLPEQQRDPAAYRPAPERIETDLPRDYLMVPAVWVRLLLPMAAMVSLFFLLRGHNLPGGGFVGGLVMAVAIIVQYMVGGTAWVESRMRLHPQQWMGLGLLFVVLTGASPWLAGQYFLDASDVHLDIPGIGDVHLSSVLLFDLGVYMLVVGATVLVLVALAHQSARVHRARAAAQAQAEHAALQEEIRWN